MVTARTARPTLGLIAFVAFAAVGIALWTQHALGMQPCPWCVLQRLIFVVITLAALPGALSRRAGVQALSSVAVMALAVAGVAAALWQHLVAARSPSCDLTLADRIVSGLHLDTALPAVFSPQASCAEAATKLLGVPYELWSLALFAVLGILAGLAFRSRSSAMPRIRRAV